MLGKPVRWGFGLACMMFVAGSSGSALAETATIRVAHNLPASTATGVYFQTLADEIQKNTAGTSMQLTVQLFPNGQLFNDTQMPDAISTGTLEIGGINLDFMNQPEIQPLRIGGLPFAFNSWEALWAAEDDDAYRKAFANQFAKAGMHHIGWVPYGTVEFFAIKPIKLPDDLKGLRLRAFGVDTSRLIQEIGGAPVSMSSQEIYQALQRQTIDGFISGPTSVYSRKLYEVVKHGTSAQLIFLSFLAEANKNWWEGLPDDVRNAIEAAAGTASKTAREFVKKEVAEAERSLTAAGVTIVRPTGAEREAWVKAASGRMDQYRSDGGKLAEELLAIAAKANGQHPAN